MIIFSHEITYLIIYQFKIFRIIFYIRIHFYYITIISKMPNTESKHGGKKKRRVGGKLKQSKYCRLMQYITDKSPDLAEVFERLCITGDLTPRHGENGVTLLYPKEKSYIDDIVKAMEKGDEETALKMVRSLIIPEYIKDLASFKQKTTVGNRLGVAFNVESASSSGAKIAPDVELESSDFKWLKRFDKQEQNVNVFTVKKGRLPTEGKDKYVAPLRQKRMALGKDMKKVGGSEAGLKKRIINGLVESIMAGKDTEYACSLLLFIKYRDANRFKALLPLLNWEPAVTVLTILNCDMGDLIPQEMCIFGTAKKYVELLNSVSNNDDASRVLQSEKMVRKEFTNASAADIIGKVDKCYEELLQGKINGVGKVFSDETTKLLGSVSKKKWLDEMAYTVGHLLKLVPRSDGDGLMELLKDYWCGTRTGSNYDAELHITSKSVITQSVNRQSEFNILMRFISSSAFLHVLMPQAQAQVSSGDMHSVPPAYYNMDVDAYNKVNSSSTIEQAMPSIAEIIAAEWPAAKV